MQSTWRLSGAVVVALVALSACREPGIRNGLGAFTANPEDVSFGAVAVGRDRVLDVTLVNDGRVPYSVYEVAPSVPNVVVDGFEAVTLQPGVKHVIKVRFAPQVEGEVTGALTIRTDEAEEPYQVRFDGRGVQALASLKTQALHFGDVELETTKVLNMVVENPTEVETSIRFTLSGDTHQFSSSEADKELVLQPRELRNIPIAFKPIQLAGSVGRATFTLCAICEPAVVELSGEGIAAKLDVSPSRVDFGRVALGATATQQVVVTNLGTEPVPFNGARLELDDVHVFDAKLVMPSQATMIAPGSSLTFEVTYSPKVSTANEARLVIDAVSDNTPNGLRVGLKGEGGVSCVSLLPRAVDFGMVPEGMNATRRVDVFNRCSYDVTLLETHVQTTSGGYFSLAQSTGIVVAPAGQVTSVKVTYTPKPGVTSSEGLVTFKIQEQNATSTDQVTLKGASKAFAPCQWSFLPGTLDFGAVPVGAEVSLGVALKNVGNDQCFVGGMQLASGSDSAFTATPMTSGVIEPGGTMVLKITFKPQSQQTYGGMAEAWVNHPTNNHPTAVVHGLGVQGCFALQPTDIDFGTTKLSCGPRTRTVVAYNTCTAPVTISEAFIDAAATGDLSLTHAPSLPFTLQPGNQAAFEVTYAPTDDGVDSAALRVTADGVMHTAGLSGLGLSQPTKTDTFVQETQAKVDVLFVIDNSGSMMEEQQSLGQNFAAFLSAAQAQFVDYQIGVTTTGIDPSPGGWSVCPGGVDGGEAGRLFPVAGTTPRIITPATPNAAQVFATNVNVGWCHWNEQGLEAAYRALSSPLVNNADDTRTSAPNDGNAGFLRPDAKLAIVFLTDEEDYSTQDVSFYETFFKGLKGNDPTMLSMSAIAGPQNLASCPTASSTGSRYIKLANATGGIVESICTQDWASSLQNLSSTTFGPKRTFPLSDTPADPNQLTVTVNGVAVTGSWSYDATTNSVTFDETAAPAAGSVIEVTYPLGC